MFMFVDKEVTFCLADVNTITDVALLFVNTFEFI